MLVPLLFVVEFIAFGEGTSTHVVGTMTVKAQSEAEALNQLDAVQWPNNAVAFRLLDMDGRELFPIPTAGRRRA